MYALTVYACAGMVTVGVLALLARVLIAYENRPRRDWTRRMLMVVMTDRLEWQNGRLVPTGAALASQATLPEPVVGFLDTVPDWSDRIDTGPLPEVLAIQERVPHTGESPQQLSEWPDETPGQG